MAEDDEEEDEDSQAEDDEALAGGSSASGKKRTTGRGGTGGREGTTRRSRRHHLGSGGRRPRGAAPRSSRGAEERVEVGSSAEDESDIESGATSPRARGDTYGTKKGADLHPPTDAKEGIERLLCQETLRRSDGGRSSRRCARSTCSWVCHGRARWG